MVDRIPKRERLMNLVSALLASRDPVPFREIVGQVIGYDDPAGDEALEKRFDRDKADLRRLGIPIEYMSSDDGTRAGYVVPRDDVFQQKVTFTPQEHLLLAIAGRVGAAATGGGALEEALKSALRKLAVDLVGPDPLDDVAPITVLRARSGAPEILGNLSALSRAVSGNRRVRLRYRSVSSGEELVREVDPYGLGLAYGAWYLAGFCHLRGAIRLFKVCRIVGTVEVRGGEGSSPVFRVPDDFRLEDHVGREAWDLGDGRPEIVRLSVDPAAVTAGVLPGARTVGAQNGRMLLEVEVRRPRALVPWVLSRGGEVEIVEPIALREAVRDEAARLLERYGAVASPAPRREDAGAEAAVAESEAPA